MICFLFLPNENSLWELFEILCGSQSFRNIFISFSPFWWCAPACYEYFSRTVTAGFARFLFPRVLLSQKQLKDNLID